MNFIELTPLEAFDKQSKGEIILVDASPSSLENIPHEYGGLWKENYKRLCLKAHHLPSTKVIQFYQPKYLVCITNIETTEDSKEFTWRYLYGVENKTIQNKTSDTVEYIYVLTNPEYPDLIKIGMTTDTVHKRVDSVNNSGVVYEWEPIFALPVEKNTAYKVEQTVHKAFEHLRVSSNKGSKREFFTLSPFQAFDKIREVGSLFQVGEPIIF